LEGKLNGSVLLPAEEDEDRVLQGEYSDGVVEEAVAN
jgi:hypothetical protein